MFSQPIIFPAKRRVRRKRRFAQFGAPPVANQIVSVQHGEVFDQIRVTLSSPLQSWDDVSKMLAVRVDGGEEIAASALTDEGAGNLVFSFDGEDVSATTLWRVPGAGNYHFADDQPLVEPLSGSIE